jgi:hypothetical protein
MSEKLIRSIVKQIISERIVSFDGGEYDIPDEEYDKISNLVQFGIEEPSEDTPSRAVDVEGSYKSVLSADPELAEILQQLGLETKEEMMDRLSSEQPELFIKNEKTGKVKAQRGKASDAKSAVKTDQGAQLFPLKERDAVKQLIIAAYQEDPEQLKNTFRNDFQQSDLPTSDTEVVEIQIPVGFSKMAEYSLTGGKSIGAGEFVIPFMFAGAQISPGGNAIHDVSIDGVGYHVKADNPASGIRFGPRKGGAAAGSKMARDISAVDDELWIEGEDALSDADLAGMSSLEIAEGLLIKIIKKFSRILKDAKTSGSPMSTRSQYDSLEPTDIYNAWSDEAAERAVGGGYGTIFYHDNKLIFVPEAAHSLRQLTQLGRYLLGGPTVGESIRGKLEENMNRSKENLIREYIREALLTEAFTKTDEKAIEVMARKEIDKKWKDHEKMIDKMFGDRDKTLFRNDAFYKVIAQIYQQLQRAYAEDQFKYAARYTRKDIPLARFRPS